MIAFRSSLKRASRLNRWSSTSGFIEKKPAEESVQLGERKKAPETGDELQDVADRITRLNLLQVAELTDLLKKRLNLPDTPVMGFGAGAAFPAAGASALKLDPVEEEEKPAQVSYTVKLVKFDEKQKVPLIKEIKNCMEGMNLVQAKKFVDSIPAVIKKDISKAEAEKLKEVLTKVGAEIELAS